MVRMLKVSSTEEACCNYCDRRVKKTALMIRVLDNDGRLEHLLLFCNQGCAFAAARENTPGLVSPPGGSSAC